jgi:hypothetical protein
MVFERRITMTKRQWYVDFWTLTGRKACFGQTFDDAASARVFIAFFKRFGIVRVIPPLDASIEELRQAYAPLPQFLAFGCPT